MLGIFGGTFDPIHDGHLHLALSLAEIHNLEEVWFIPAKENPLKMGKTATPFAHRLAMIELAIEEIPLFSVKSLENELPGPSYTVRLLEEIKKRVARPLALLLGEDAARSLPLWREAERLCSLATLLVGARHTGVNSFSFPDHLSLERAVQKGWTPLPLLEISATTLRDRLAQGFFCKHLMPPKVVDYIHKNVIY